MSKRNSRVTPYSCAAEIGRLEKELLANAPESVKSWGRDVNLKDPLLQRLNSLGHLLMQLGAGPESEVEVIALEVVSALGNHSFISRKTGKAYPASEPDVFRLMTLLADYCKMVGLKGHEPSDEEIFDLEAWRSYEDTNSVFKA